MKYILILLFILISTQLWAVENKQTYFCLSASDQSQKLLVLADVDDVTVVGYLDTDEYKLNDENGVLVGPSTAGSGFFKLASGKLDLMSSAGMWSGVCHQFTNENAQALSNASKSGGVVVSDQSKTVVCSSESTSTPPPFSSLSDANSSGVPSWITAPPPDSMQGQAMQMFTNPITGETYNAPSTGYSINTNILGGGSCDYNNPKNCTQVELCSKATYN